MLDQTTIAFLAKAHGKTEAEITTANSSAESVALGNLVGEFYTMAENETRNENVRKAAIEIAVKQTYQAAGIEFTAAEKTPEKLAEKLKSHYSTSGNAEQAQKIKDLEKQIDGMSKEDKDYAEMKKKHDTLKETYDSETIASTKKYDDLNLSIKKRDKDSFIMGTMPEENLLISRENMLLIGSNDFDIFQGEDNKWYVKKDGETVADKIGEPVLAEKLLKEHWEDNFTNKQGGKGGNGGGGNQGQAGMSPEDARKHIENNTDLELTSSEGMAEYNKVTEGYKE